MRREEPKPVEVALMDAIERAEGVQAILAALGATAPSNADPAQAAQPARAAQAVQPVTADARARGLHLGLIGLHGSASTVVAATIARRMAEQGRAPLVFLAPDASTLDEAREDFLFLLGPDRVAHFPESGVEPYDLQIPRARERADRLETLSRLLDEHAEGRTPWVVLTTPGALFQRIPHPLHLSRFLRTVRVGERIEPEALAAFLARLGYHPESIVGEYGDFSRRGGIVDVYSFGRMNPVRLEFDDDEIVSMREFDVFTQRSQAVLSSFTILPLWEVVIEESDWEGALASGFIPPAGPQHEHLMMLRSEGSFEGIEWMMAGFGIERGTLLDYVGAGRPVMVDDPLYIDRLLREARERVREAAAEGGREPGRARDECETGMLKALYSTPDELFLMQGGLSDLLASHPAIFSGVGARSSAVDRGPREATPPNRGWTAGEQLRPPDPLEIDSARGEADSWSQVLKRSARPEVKKKAKRTRTKPRATKARSGAEAEEAHAGTEPLDDSHAPAGAEPSDDAHAAVELPDDAHTQDGAGPSDDMHGVEAVEAHSGAEAMAFSSWGEDRETAAMLPYATRYFPFATRPQERFGRNLSLVRAYIERLRGQGYEIRVLCDTINHRDRLAELMEDVPAQFLVGNLAAGFAASEIRLAVLTDHEIFERLRRRRAGRRYSRGISLKELLAMRPGDFVVHIDHGIGVYRGIERLPVNGQLTDCMKIEYAGGDKLFIPVDQLALVQKYSAEEGHRPVLSRLGTNQWAKTKARVKKSIKEMASELLRLYSLRKAHPGHAFAADTVWQAEMEARFPFDETPDQLKAIQEVKADMERPVPMDRLICGDVGYGKTEVAIRAAFKAVMEGKQVAVLVPTTLLAQQHYDTFTERLRGFPACIEMLSRFRSTKENAAVVRDLAAGKVDIVVGTHRLIQKDVRFHDLGLVIVDEEQRFGVAHKERLKHLRTQVDVLTMTATPIPRTMNLALMGARDMSAIHTPPRDRRPIQTEIVEFADEVIRYALMREADRGGQSFFVHNRVESIDAMANYVRSLVPHLRVAVGHGQMRETQLETVMRNFLNREYDVLVSTMIIESGLDMPNVNTILVNRTDTFGLAQLYQLRGRVGRSARKAYAYLLVPPHKVITEEAMKRLKAIEEFEDLGSGFQLAMRDLEIRGSGNVFGSEQHGFVLNVGFDLYMRLLNEAMQEIKGLPAPEVLQARVVTDLQAFLPGDYISVDAEKMNLYKSLADAESVEKVDELAAELSDRFGRMPAPAENLFELRRLRIRATKAGVETLTLRDGGVRLDMTRALTRKDVQCLIGQMPVPVAFVTHGRHRVEVAAKEVRGEMLLVAAQVLECLTRA
ncbi:MAG: transcription-repair coupling factor [Candidatus Eisenbacteria bacterium]|nr:transcription-repair coupling factor [Candidatus Eisenbacteria bacterium]